MELVFMFLPVIALVIISLMMSPKWKQCEKIDTGIELCYWKLSYRRKFIRTLWMIPLSIITIIGFHISFLSNIGTCLIAVIFSIMLLIQAVYNYKKNAFAPLYVKQCFHIPTLHSA